MTQGLPFFMIVSLTIMLMVVVVMIVVSQCCWSRHDGDYDGGIDGGDDIEHCGCH